MKTVDIRCDGCGRGLTDAGSMPTYALELSPWTVPNSGNVMCAIHVEPDISKSHHFCGLRCLDHWRGREKLRESLWAEWLERRKAERGVRIGSAISVPSASDDEHRTERDAIEAKIMEAFPMQDSANPHGHCE